MTNLNSWRRCRSSINKRVIKWRGVINKLGWCCRKVIKRGKCCRI